MTDAEILDWLSMLGRRRSTQRAVVLELQKHEIEDRMSMADKRVCKRALELLAQEKAA